MKRCKNVLAVLAAIWLVVGILFTSCRDPNDGDNNGGENTVNNNGNNNTSSSTVNADGKAEIPDGVKADDKGAYIQNGILYAWKSEKAVGDITIPANVTEIGNYAFKNCTGLTSVIIPEGVTKIGAYTFYDCEDLTKVTIPASVTEIGKKAFTKCPNLKLAVVANNSNFSAAEGILYNKNKTELIAWPSASENIDLGTKIASSVTKIGDYALSDCMKLASITINESITEIGDCAFSGCEALQSAKILDSVTIIGKDSFLNCTGLTSVTLSEGVTKIGSRAFKNCTGLERVKIPASAVNHDGNPFPGCVNLKSFTVAPGNTKYSVSADGTMLLNKNGTKLYACPSASGTVKIPDTITDIGSNAFDSCAKLSSVTFPDTVTWIERDIFKNCGKLESINGLGGTWLQFNDKVTPQEQKVIGRLTLDIIKERNGTYRFRRISAGDAEVMAGGAVVENGMLVGWAPAPSGAITIPEDVTSIAKNALKDCTGLTSVTIPDSVTSIGIQAFRGCTNLQSITIPASVEDIGYGVFAACTKLTDITVEGNANYFTDDSGKILLRRDYNKGNYLVAYPSASGRNVSIPVSVTKIGLESFRDCTGLTSILIPDGTKMIETNAFMGCTVLASITIPESVQCIGKTIAQKCENFRTVNVSGKWRSGETVYETLAADMLKTNTQYYYRVDENEDDGNIPSGGSELIDVSEITRADLGPAGTSYRLTLQDTEEDKSTVTGETTITIAENDRVKHGDVTYIFTNKDDFALNKSSFEEDKTAGLIKDLIADEKFLTITLSYDDNTDTYSVDEFLAALNLEDEDENEEGYNTYSERLLKKSSDGNTIAVSAKLTYHGHYEESVSYMEITLQRN